MSAKVRDWKCMECGRRMTLRAAEKAVSVGCPKCGGVDIDLCTEPVKPEPKSKETLS